MSESGARHVKGEMTFERHLLILRRKVLVILITVVLCSVAGYFLFPYLYQLLSRFVSENLYATRIQEGFVTRLKISVLVGLFLATPLILVEAISYINPGLYRKERIIILSVSIAALLLFAAGVYFSLSVVLPVSLAFLRSEVFFPATLQRIISYNSFVEFFAGMLVAFGLCFQFPVIITLLLSMKILSIQMLIKYFRHFVIIDLVVSAILTPPDVMSQIMMATPLLALYLVSIAIGKIFKLGR